MGSEFKTAYIGRIGHIKHPCNKNMINPRSPLYDPAPSG